MLPAASRLRLRPDFTATVRRGRRAGRPRLVVHLAVQDLAVADREVADRPVEASTQAGFVVSRAVGGAVVRNRVRRQLRHLTVARLHVLPTGSKLVVRALPAAAGSTSADLAADLDAALADCVRRSARLPVEQQASR